MNARQSILLCALLAVAAPLAAHHNFAAHYIGDEIIEHTGVVTEFRFINPHARVYIAFVDENGARREWMAEGDASVALRRSGWTPDQIEPGDRVRIVGNPARNGTNTMSWDSITFMDDGARIGGGDGRLQERAAIIDRRLAEFRRQRGR